MRVLIVVTPRVAAPPERVPAMIDATVAWHGRHVAKFEAFGTFIGGGGFAVVNATDERELNQLMAEMPFTAISDVVIRPCIAGTAGLLQARDALLAMPQA